MDPIPAPLLPRTTGCVELHGAGDQGFRFGLANSESGGNGEVAAWARCIGGNEAFRSAFTLGFTVLRKRGCVGRMLAEGCMCLSGAPGVANRARRVCVSIATVSLAASVGLIALPDEVIGVLGLIGELLVSEDCSALVGSIAARSTRGPRRAR